MGWSGAGSGGGAYGMGRGLAQWAEFAGWAGPGLLWAGLGLLWEWVVSCVRGLAPVGVAAAPVGGAWAPSRQPRPPHAAISSRMIDRIFSGAVMR